MADTAKSKPKVDPANGDDNVPLAKLPGNGSKSIVKKENGLDNDSDDERPLVRLPKSQNGAGNPAADAADSDDDDKPLTTLAKPAPAAPKVKREPLQDDSDDDDAPLAAIKASKVPSKRKSAKGSAGSPAKRVKKEVADSDDDDDKPLSQAKTKAGTAGSKSKSTAGKKRPAKDAASGSQPKKRKKKEDEVPVHKWWEEEELPDGQRWRTLEHSGPLFPPDYEPLPKQVHLIYDGKPMMLEPAAEEVAGFYAMMLERDYVKKGVFNNNFFEEWKSVMTPAERAAIKSLDKCDFSLIHAHYKSRAEARKAASKEEKEKRKAADQQLKEKYGFAVVDGRRVAIGNFRIEPPGLFQGRGQHPKMGMLKRRVMPEQIIINVGKEAKAPEPPAGHKWKEVRHDNKVTWLASWTENIQGQNKYVMLAADSHIKGRNDMKKYDTARQLKKFVKRIRSDYTAQLKSKEMFERQRATALYFIDKLALRAGGEKDADEEADTVGCCNLRIEHVTAADDHTIVFDFLGKDSIRYYNEVKVEPQVWKNVKIFQRPPKEAGDDLFDRLTAPTLNKYLQSLMPGLTAKVFRTYNASITLQEQLKNTPVDGTVEEKMLAYQRANRAVAVLCNHQRAPPKTHDQQIERIDEVLKKISDDIKDVKKQRKQLKKEAKDSANKKAIAKKLELLKRKLERLEERKHKKEIQKTDKIENKTIALGTSKLNYLDPRISVAWCRKHDVPIEKVYNPTQRKKFRWAIEMTEESFEF